ncbi:hypothetical protein M422DRAFT_774158 [Sphaerobolus stellatus SS14]|nr:hypothetical protein M422DRAFT_774158 [Sphaerobolus stellatus SS14]
MSAVASPLRPFGRKEPPKPLPDPKSSYERPLKRDLTSRLLAVTIAYFGFEYSIFLITTANVSKGVPLGLLGHLIASVFFAGFALILGGIPPLFLRGRAVSEKNSSHPTRGDTFTSLISSRQTWRTLSVFSGSGFLLTILYVSWVKLTEWEDSRLLILAPTRRVPYRLNERFFYLAFFNAGLGLVFSLRDLIRQRRIVKWSPKVQWDGSIMPSMSIMVVDCIFTLFNTKAILSTAIITVFHILFFPVWYHAARAFLLPILRNLPWLSGLTRPLLHAFGRTWIVDVSWSRLLSLGLRTAFGWELVENAFDYWVTRPISVATFSPNPNQTLIAGLQSKERYFKYHAYLELLALARSTTAKAAARRTEIFTDSKTNPTLWNALSREILITLGQDYQTLLRRGRPLPAPAAASKPAIAPKLPKTPATPLIKQQIVKSSPSSKMDAFASDGAVTEVLTKSISIPAVFLPSPSTPKIAKDAVKVIEATKADIVKKIEPVAQTAKKGKKATALELLSWAEKKLPREWKVKEWWTTPSAERQARATLPEVTLDAIMIEAITHLVAASLKEDTIGIVQRDIPRILEALLSFLGEAETYQAELEKRIPPEDDPAAKKVEALQDAARAIAVVVPVVQSLREGIGLIAKTFGDRLGVYRFPPPTAKRLQTFMDYL